MFAHDAIVASLVDAVEQYDIFAVLAVISPESAHVNALVQAFASYAVLISALDWSAVADPSIVPSLVEAVEQ